MSLVSNALCAALLLVGRGGAAQTASPDWLRLSERSVAVVTATVAEPVRHVERLDKRDAIQRIQPDGRVVVHMPDVSDYLVGSVLRFSIGSIAKSDGLLTSGATMDVYHSAISLDCPQGARYLLFLDRPIRRAGDADAVNGWTALEGTVLTAAGAAEEAPFDPLAAYGVPPSSATSPASPMLRITSENESEVKSILELIRTRSAPRIVWDAPALGEWIRGDARLKAQAADDVAVLGVQFRVDMAPLGNEIAPQRSGVYEAVWNSRDTPDGAHVLDAVARDAGGSTTASEPVEVVVDNTPPTLTIVADPATLGSPLRRARLVSVEMAVAVADGLTPLPQVKLVSIECGTTCRPETDIVGAEYGADDREFSLRARSIASVPYAVYEITYSASDSAGNEVTASTSVRVERPAEPLPPGSSAN